MGLSCFGYLSADWIIAKFDVIKALGIAYAAVAILITLIIIVGSETHIILYALLFFLLKSFVCMGYSALFVAHVYLFDARILATSLGVCGIFARSAAMVIPLYAEHPNLSLIHI